MATRSSYTRAPARAERRRYWVRLGPRGARRLVQHVERRYQTYRGDAPDADDRTLLAAVAVP